MKPSKSYMSQPMSQEAQQTLRALVLLEDLPGSQVGAIEAAAASCRIDARLYQKAGDLVRELDTRGGDLVLLSARGSRAAEVCAAVRRIVGKRAVLIGIGRQVDGISFGEFVGWGGDDLVEADGGEELGVRLRAIRADILRAGPARTLPGQREDGRFLVMAPVGSELLASARVIEQAGHRAVVVETPEDAKARLAVSRDIRVVVDVRTSGALPFVDYALEQNSCAGIVLACPPQQLGQLAARYEAHSDRLLVLDCCSSADTVLLAANQLKAQRRNRRTTERLHYATLVSFREAGAAVDHVGCTYDVSAGGMYIRTTAMPTRDRVWLEVAPPGSMTRVRLEGRVAWRTPVTRDPSAPFPVGIGVEIADGTMRCLDGWLEGYRHLQSKLHVHTQPEPAPPPPPEPSRCEDVTDEELDPASRPTVRPPSAVRRRAQVWSSMTSGPSASYLAGQAVPLEQTSQVAAVDAGSA
jgi:hypothetical protein